MQLYAASRPRRFRSNLATIREQYHPPARGEHCYRLGATAHLITLKKVLISIESPFAARNRPECD